MAAVLAALSALMYGAADFCGGLASRKGTLVAVLVVSQAAGLVLVVAAAVSLGTPLSAGADLAWGAVAGVCGVLGLAALYRALAATIITVASPTAAVVGAVIPVLFGFLRGERPGLFACVGIAIAVPAIILLTYRGQDGRDALKVRRALLLGAAAGLGFGLFFVAISRAQAGSGLWPLLAARASTVTIVGLFALLTGRSLAVPRSTMPIALLGGVLDMGANIAFLLASRSGMLATVAVITSLYPGPTVLLARLVLKEKLTAPRLAGIALAVAGVAFISVK